MLDAKPKSKRQQLWQRRGYVMVYSVPSKEAVQLPAPGPRQPDPKRPWANYALRVLVKIAGAAF